MNAGLVSPDHVLLDLAATTREEAVRAVAGLLRADGQIANWDQFWASVGPRQIVDLKGGGCGWPLEDWPCRSRCPAGPRCV